MINWCKKAILVLMISINVNYVYSNDFIPDIFPVKNYDDVYVARSVELVTDNNQSYLLNNELIIKNRTSKKSLTITSSAKGIVERVSKYEIDNNYYFEIIVSNISGFKLIFDGISTTDLKRYDFISKGQIIGTIDNQGIDIATLHYQVYYKGMIINPEILYFNINDNNLNLDLLNNLTREISEFQYNPTKTLLNSSFFDYPKNIDTSIRVITDSKTVIGEHIKIGSSVDDLIITFGTPFRISFKDKILSQKISQYLILKDKYYNEISRIDFRVRDENENNFELYFDIVDGTVKTIGIYQE